MTSHPATRKLTGNLRSRRERFLRAISVNLLCLVYLMTNTGVIPVLTQGKQCRCADEVKASSSCCCFNSQQKKPAVGSCCTSKSKPTRSCCSKQKKLAADSPADPSKTTECQMSSLCGCGSSSSQGFVIAAPRDLNARPEVTVQTAPSSSLAFHDDTPITLAVSPETPPPQNSI